MDLSNILALRDPLKFFALMWPDQVPYKEQREILVSVNENDQTYVPAGHMLGKDWVAGRAVVWAFLTRGPCRIITTSAKDDHLRVLWSEINAAVRSSRFPLTKEQGGPLVVNHQELRKMVKGERCPISYVKGMVASQDTIAGMQGHHVAQTGDGVWRTLFVADEASSVPDEYYQMARTWANRMLVIGNCWPCENFFKHAVKGKPGTEDKGGDILRRGAATPEEDVGTLHRHDQGGNGADRGRDAAHGYYRRVIRIRAVDSPNVRLALAERGRGREPSGRIIVPGVKPWSEYQKDLATCDKAYLTVSHDAEFYEGQEVRLFPADWLRLAGRPELWELCRAHPAECIGIDPGEGGANTSMAAVNRYGVKELVSKKTPNTAVITSEAKMFGARHGVSPEKWIFDRGGGGKQHADRLLAEGFPVRTVAFGEGIVPELRRGTNTLEIRKDIREDHYAYKNRRAEMYGELRLLIDPAVGPAHFGLGSVQGGPRPTGFAIPDAGGAYAELRRQLGPIPLVYDQEGRLELPPKNNRPGAQKASTSVVSLTDLLGCSPDEADAVVLGIHGMLHKKLRPRVGAL